MTITGLRRAVRHSAVAAIKAYGQRQPTAAPGGAERGGYAGASLLTMEQWRSRRGGNTQSAIFATMGQRVLTHCIKFGTMSDEQKRIPARFYQTEPGGRVPVREWLRELSPEDRKIVGEDIKTVEYGWPIGMPLCRPLSEGLWEVRSDISAGRIARVLFCISDGCMVLLHGFIKKTQKTPVGEIITARRRMREVLQ